MPQSTSECRLMTEIESTLPYLSDSALAKYIECEHDTYTSICEQEQSMTLYASIKPDEWRNIEHKDNLVLYTDLAAVKAGAVVIFHVPIHRRHILVQATNDPETFRVRDRRMLFQGTYYIFNDSIDLQRLLPEQTTQEKTIASNESRECPDTSAAPQTEPRIGV